VYALLLQGRSTLGTELNTAWASARGQLITALQVSAFAPSARLREVQVSMAAAAKDGARSRAWEAHAAAAAALTGQNADQGAASDPGRKRLLELNVQAVDPALGFGTLAPGARLQHELTAGIERAKHRALWVRARVVRPPGNDATTWHAAENAEYLKAYAAKAAFECACGISRAVLTAWPGTGDGHGPRPSTTTSFRPSPPPTWALETQS
jgi:hypothetical protein